VDDGGTAAPFGCSPIRHRRAAQNPPTTCERLLSALLRLAAGEQLTPVVGLHLDVEAPGGGLDPSPGSVPLGVGDPFDLVR
jgi:hypothetical protein